MAAQIEAQAEAGKGGAVGDRLRILRDELAAAVAEVGDELSPEPAPSSPR